MKKSLVFLSLTFSLLLTIFSCSVAEQAQTTVAQIADPIPREAMYARRRFFNRSTRANRLQ